MNFNGLIAGLGNPGQKYQGTRHNCGFMLAGLLLKMAQAEGNVEELNGKKFNSLLWRVTLPALQGVWLVAMPQTFMNESGLAIRPLLAWHNLTPTQLIVVHDELDLPAGALRFKFGGGLAGHNGLASIRQCIGTQDFYRLRIGIGKPANKAQMLTWVLGRPDKRDGALIAQVMPEALETLSIFTRDGAQAATRFAHAVQTELIENQDALSQCEM